MAYSLIAHTASGTNSSGTTSSGVDTTGADLIVVAAAYYNGSAAPTLTDSRGNTWTGLTEVAAAGGSYLGSLRFFYCQAPSVGAGHTFTLSGASSYAALAVAAFSGSAASPADQQGGSGGTATPGSITPSEANELVLTAVTDSSPGGIATAVSGGFAVLDTLANSSGNHFGVGLAYLVQTSAAAANPTWSAGNVFPASAIASFKAGGGGGGGGGVFSWANYYYRHVAGLSA